MSYNYQWNQILSTDKKIVLKSMANVYQYLAYDTISTTWLKFFKDRGFYWSIQYDSYPPRPKISLVYNHNIVEKNAESDDKHRLT
jgi:hypothetical protein